MASITAPERLQISLDAIHDYLDDLPDVAAEWDEMDEDAQVSECLRWDYRMAACLTELDQGYRAGDMTSAQREQYAELLRRLQEMLPLIERMDLMRPPVSLTLPDEHDRGKRRAS